MRIIFIVMLWLPCTWSLAQQPGWQNSDMKEDGVMGISTEKAYLELLKGKMPHKVIVAVIDSGIDTTHEDLKSILWVNSKERAGNRKDDDKNGYIDDVNGWNFIGGPTDDVHYDNYEITRLVREFKSFYDSLSYTEVPEKYREGYQKFRKMKEDYDNQLSQSIRTIMIDSSIESSLSAMLYKMRKDSLTIGDLEHYSVASAEEENVKKMIVSQLSFGKSYASFKKLLDGIYDMYRMKVKYQLNQEYDPRRIIGDNYDDVSQQYYGNNNIYGPDAVHGTHVCGIIAASRDNGIGIKGVANCVEVMGIRVLPDGDERDKDVANAIRYAVDNGAKVINLSFGKPYVKNKTVVDDAVRYAMRKDVLIVHAAGNDGIDLDDPANQFYPTKYYDDGNGQAKAWITVGASGWKDDTTLLATFSNYGHSTVDIFAPGVQIYSTVPQSEYEYFNGTSMAAPVVTGLAALIKGYYPELNAVEIKQIILNSTFKVDHEVKVKTRDNRTKLIPFSQTCVSGGIANAYQALKLAEGYVHGHFK